MIVEGKTGKLLGAAWEELLNAQPINTKLFDAWNQLLSMNIKAILARGLSPLPTVQQNVYTSK